MTPKKHRTFFIFVLLLFTSTFANAEIDKFEGLLDNNEYQRRDMYSIEYQHQRPQSICRDYEQHRSECDAYTTWILYPYHTWQDRVKKTYLDFRHNYNPSSVHGESTLVAYYMGTYNLSYDVALYNYNPQSGKPHELRTLTFLEFNGADMLALQISYITNVWGNFLNYAAYLIGNERIGFLDSIYFIVQAAFGVGIGLLLWMVGWFATIGQFIFQFSDSIQSIFDADYWRLLGSSLWHGLSGLVTGVFYVIYNLGIEILDFLWTTVEMVIWMTIGLNPLDGLLNMIMAGAEEVWDLVMGVLFQAYYTCRVVLHIISFGYIPLPDTSKAFIF